MASDAKSCLDMYGDSDGAIIGDLKLYGPEDDVLHDHEVAHDAAVDSNTLDVVYTQRGS
jgi:hypothetical protein